MEVRKWKLTVPYEEKEEAKSKGCKWNWKERYWYLSGTRESYLRLPQTWRQTDDHDVSDPFDEPRPALKPSPLDVFPWIWNGAYWYRQTPSWDL